LINAESSNNNKSWYLVKNAEMAYKFATLVKDAALSLGFDSFNARLISLGASEVAVNAIRYACNVQASINITDNGKGIHVTVTDEGGGIEDINLAMTSGFSLHNSLGLGLSAAKRSVDEMVINSDENGTIVHLTRYLPLTNDIIDIGAVSFPRVGAHINQNAYWIKRYHGDSTLVALYDFTFKVNSHKTFAKIKSFIEINYTLTLSELTTQSQALLYQLDATGELNMGLLRITPKEIQAVTIGNILIDNILTTPNDMSNIRKSITLSQSQYHCPTPSAYCFVLRSSGVTSSDIELPIDKAFICATKHAELIFDSHAYSDEDASVIVVKSNE